MQTDRNFVLEVGKMNERNFRIGISAPQLPCKVRENVLKYEGPGLISSSRVFFLRHLFFGAYIHRSSEADLFDFGACSGFNSH